MGCIVELFIWPFKLMWYMLEITLYVMYYGIIIGWYILKITIELFSTLIKYMVSSIKSSNKTRDIENTIANNNFVEKNKIQESKTIINDITEMINNNSDYSKIDSNYQNFDVNKYASKCIYYLNRKNNLTSEEE